MAAAAKELGPSPTSVLGMGFGSESVEADSLLASVGGEHLLAAAGHPLLTQD